MLFVDLSPAQTLSFQKTGYVIIRDFCNEQEVKRMYEMAMSDDTVSENTLQLIDQAGKKIKFSLWFSTGDDVFGYLTRSEKIINSVYQLMDSDAPVCHFHTRVTYKEPFIGGAWEWHQDYGYWYKNGFMFPDQLISVMVALTPAHRNKWKSESMAQASFLKKENDPALKKTGWEKAGAEL